MSVHRSISAIAIALLIVGLAAGGAGGYFYAYTTAQSKIAECEAQIEDLNSQVSSLSSTVSQLQTDKSDYEAQISDLEGQVSDLQGQISSMETQISDYEAQIALLESGIEDVIQDYRDQISELEARISTFKAVLQTYIPDPIKIGITATSTDVKASVEAIAAIAKSDIKQYCVEEGLPYNFDFVVANNYGDPNEAVENTIMFDNLGINLIVGHSTDQECSLSLNYVNTHGMLMISPGSDSRDLAVSGDNLYRMTQTDLGQAPVMAETLDSWGIRAVIVIQRRDAWGDGLYGAFVNEFEARGGVIYERIRYDPDPTTFIGTMNTAEAEAKDAVAQYGKERVAVQLISTTEEAAKMANFADAFPTLYDLYWFSTGATAKTALHFQSASEEADRLKFFSPLITLEENMEYALFAAKYQIMVGKAPDFQASAMYDACWLYALSIIEAWTTDTTFVKQALPGVAEDYQGASGLCRFDRYGDRYSVDYRVWGYGLKDGQVTAVDYGYYDSSDGRVTWYTEKGINPPG